MPLMMQCDCCQEGKALKLLATAARLDIEDFLQKKVYLEVSMRTFNRPMNLKLHVYVITLLPLQASLLEYNAFSGCLSCRRKYVLTKSCLNRLKLK